MNDDRIDPNTRESDDDVRRWLRIGGRRVEPGAGVSERVRNATREHWQRTVDRRSRRKSLLWAAAAATVLIAVATIGWSLRDEVRGGDDRRAVASVLAIEGEVSIRGSLAVADQRIESGTEIRTTGDSRLALTLAETGHSVRLDRETRVRVVGAETLVLENGAIYVDSGTDPLPAIPVRIETPRGVVQDIGTRFELRLVGADLRIRVRDGAVVVKNENGPRRVDAASELRMRPDGSAIERPIPIHGADWGWVTAFSAMPAIEGWTAYSFVEWAAREGGWTLQWEDPAVTSHAARTELAGGIRGLSVEDALAVVLPTCGLTHRLRDGVLYVTMDGSEP